MSTVQEIEKAIVSLSPREVNELFLWMDERYADALDTHLAAALDAGVMDERIQKALAERMAGTTRSL